MGFGAIFSWSVLKRGPCQKLPLNCNSQSNHKDQSLTLLTEGTGKNFEKPEKILKGLYGMLSNCDRYNISIGNCNSELIFGMRAYFRILYKDMASYPIISKIYL